jgi:phospholipase C
MELSHKIYGASLLVWATLFLAGCQGLVGSPFQVTVTPAGAGSGTVTSAPAGIDCGTACTATIQADTPITLTASPVAGSVFAGWSGACSGAGTCTISTSPASVTATFGATLQSINHVVFMMQENHTFDNYFGMLNPYRKANGWTTGDDGQTYTVDGIDDKLGTISNADDEGANFNLFKLKSTCIDDDSSAWLQSYGDVNRYDFLVDRPILTDGFVHTAEGYAKYCAVPANDCTGGQFTDLAGQRAMGYYDQGFLNYYYYMASQFAVSDRWFSPVASESVPNRMATMTGGTTQGLVHDPGSSEDKLGVQLDIETIFQELDSSGVAWKIYYSTTEDQCLTDNDGDCGSGQPINKFPATTFTNFTYSLKYVYANSGGGACTPPTEGSGQAVGDPNNAFCIDTTHIATISQFFTDLKNNALPAFAWIDPGYSNDDEHPGSGQSILLGQAQVASIFNAFMASSSWKDSILFWSYDEGGGPYDHVPPVPNHTNDNTDPGLGITTDISTIAVNPDQYKPCVPANPTDTPTLHCDLRTSPPNSNADPGANPDDAPAQEGFAAQLGFRLPNMIISAFTRKHFVSHTPMDHTAVIKFVENRFIGPSAHLTQRDAAQPDLTEFFDFANAPWFKPPTPPAPVTSTSLGFNPCTPTEMGP